MRQETRRRSGRPSGRKLDLCVNPSHEDDFAVGSPAGGIARLIQALSRLKRTFEKTLCVERRGAEIPFAYAETANIQLARYPDGKRLAMGVQNVKAAVGQGLSGGDFLGVV